MAYTSTVDERYIGLFISKRAGEYDASGSFGNGYQIGQYQTAYGSLVLLGYRADFDLYALGTLNSGTINVSASSSTWDSFSTLDGDGIGWSFITPTIYLYNSSGQQVASGFGSLSYSYNYLSAGNFYVGVEGSTYASSQYALSYSYSAPFNYAPTNSTLAIIGTGALGSSLTVSGGWIDSNGLNVANTVTGYSYSWYTSGDNSTNWILVGTGSTYVVKETDLGKYIDVLISYTDDNKFSEIVSPNSALIPGQTDTTPPTISYSTNKSSLGVGETATITFTLSESSTNFTAGDVSVIGGTLSNFSGSGTTYTATFTPTSNSTATGVINVNSGVFTDAAGNANPTSMTLSIAVNTVPADTTPPTIAISTSSSSLSQSQTANITFTLSESSTNFTAGDITVTGGTLSNFSGSGTTYNALFTPTANSTTNGVVRVASGVFTDAAGNANADGSDTNNTVTMSVNTVPVGKKIEGTTGNDIMTGTSGNDTLDGGAGTDTASWSHASSNYQLTATPTGWKVTDKTGANGTDTVTNIEKLQFADRTVIIESKDHGSYADLPTQLYQFFITAFNAAPGVTYMDQLAEAYRYGLSVKQIVDIFTTKKQFTDVYSPSLSHSDMATQLVNNIVKNSASTSAKTEAISDIKGALDLGWTVGDVIYTVFGNLARKDLSDPNWGNTAKQFNNEIAVAKYYTEVLNQSTTDLETLRDAIQPVTQATDVSSDVVIAQIVGVALMTGGLGPGP